MASNDFAKNSFLYQKRLATGCESLHGVCAGILADGVVNEPEARFLSLWLSSHEEISEVWPGKRIAERVKVALADGIIAAEELEHLKQTLSDLVGGCLEETGAVGQSTRMPIDDSVELAFPGRSFCLTGDFLYGPRSKVGDAIVNRGGILLQSVNMTLDYLVIGYMSSRDWKFASFGTKITKAVEHQERGKKIAIISEEYFTAHL